MTKGSYTPGPWFVGHLITDDDDPDSLVVSVGPYSLEDRGGSHHYEDTICEVWDNPNLAETAQANASLIAAAPRMYAALEALLERYLVMGCGEGIEALEAKHALSEARGEQS